MPFDLEGLLTAVGYPGLFFMVFAETGLLVGFFLPGDSLLLTAGLLIQRGHFELFGMSGLWVAIPLLIVAAVLGDATGYAIGKNFGPRLYERPESRFFKRRHLDQARSFYERHGGKTIFLARFVAIVRTFAPTIAGAAGMPYRKFAVWNVLGAGAWVVSLLLLGYFVGTAVPNVELVFAALVALIIAVSLLPAAIGLLAGRMRRA